MTTSFEKTTRFFDIDEDTEERHAHMHVAMPRRCYECGGDIQPDENFDSDTYAPAGTCTEKRGFCSMFCAIDYLVNQCDVPVRYIFDRQNARGAEYEASLAEDFPHTMKLVRSPMSTQTPQPTQQSVVSSYPAAKAVVYAKSPVVTVVGPPAKAVVTPTSPPKEKPASKASGQTYEQRFPEIWITMSDSEGEEVHKPLHHPNGMADPTKTSSLPMTVQTHVEQELDENGDLHRVQHQRKAVYEARPVEVQPNIVNEFNNARNMAAAAIKARDHGSTSSSSNTVDQQPQETQATGRTIPSRQIHAAVARVNNEKYTYPLPWGSHQNAMNAILEQRRRFATRQWLSGNTSAAAATDGDSDDEIPVETCRVFKSILNAAQEQNQAQSASYGPVLTEEQQQALHEEEARMFHMLREYSASRLRRCMLPEEYAKFIHTAVRQGYHETTVKMSSRQLDIMATVHKEIHRVQAYKIALRHAY